MNYDYYKNKYKKITIQLDREKDADVIRFINANRGSFKQIFCLMVRKTIELVGGGKHENISTK